MLLRSFSFIHKEIDADSFYVVWEEICRLKWYFYKFSKDNADEAMQKTLYHTLLHYNPAKGGLSAYIKKLAREITKPSGKLVFVDFMEQTLADSGDSDTMQATIDTGRLNDFSDDVITSIHIF